MSVTVFPVGHGAGAFVPDEEQDPAHHVVRVGRSREELTESEFGAWVLAHRAATAGELAAAGFAQEMDELLRRGLLVEVGDPMSFARSYRLAPLFLGLGNEPDDLERFHIGVPGLEPLATVDATAFELWQWGAVAPSLWSHCEVLATIRHQNSGDPATAGEQLGLVLSALPSLLEGFVAVLDPVSV
ncbi:hypothetical protein [Flindersiella endophytica]